MNLDTIILHHSLTKDSDTVSWGAIRTYHKNKGWKDIGYHFGIEDLRGQTEILVGRMTDRMGAHCSNDNVGSIGICFVGNFDIIEPPIESWNKGIELVKFLMRTYGITRVVGHTELNPYKTCPGKLFNLDKFRDELL